MKELTRHLIKNISVHTDIIDTLLKKYNITLVDLQSNFNISDLCIYKLFHCFQELTLNELLKICDCLHIQIFDLISIEYFD